MNSQTFYFHKLKKLSKNKNKKKNKFKKLCNLFKFRMQREGDQADYSN